jgi:hypothetical protein
MIKVGNIKTNLYQNRRFAEKIGDSLKMAKRESLRAGFLVFLDASVFFNLDRYEEDRIVCPVRNGSCVRVLEREHLGYDNK